MPYRVVITGVQQAGKQKDQIARNLARVFRRSTSDIMPLLSGSRRILKKNIDKTAADRLCMALLKAGVEALVEQEDFSTPSPMPPAATKPEAKAAVAQATPALTLEQLTEQAEQRQQQGHCPKCGFIPQAGDQSLNHQDPCPACGAYARKYLSHLYKQRETTRLDGLRDKNFQQAGKTAGNGWTEYIPSGMFRWARWVFVAIGALIFITGGYSVFKLPSHELLYYPEQPIVRCAPIAADAPFEQIVEALVRMDLYEEAEQCMMLGSCKPLCRADYALQIANTGLKPQEQVVIRLDQSWMDKTRTAPAFLNYDRVQRPVSSRNADGETSYALGMMKPTEQIVMRTGFVIERRENAPAWSELLREVKTPYGEAYQGLPALSIITRMSLKLFSAFSFSSAVTTLSNRFLDDEPSEQIAEWAPVRQTPKADQVDLYLTVNENDRPKTGRRPYYDYSITIRNRGGQDATEVTAKLDLAKNFSLQMAMNEFSIHGEVQHAIVYLGLEQRGSRNPCSKSSDGSYQCTIGKVRHQDIATLFLRLQPSGAAADKLNRSAHSGELVRFEHNISVEGNAFEANMEDNRLIIAIQSGTAAR